MEKSASKGFFYDRERKGYRERVAVVFKIEHPTDILQETATVPVGLQLAEALSRAGFVPKGRC